MAEFAQLITPQAVVNVIALYKVLFQNLVCPLTELDTTLALYTVTYGDDDVKVVKRHWFLYPINV